MRYNGGALTLDFLKHNNTDMIALGDMLATLILLLATFSILAMIWSRRQRYPMSPEFRTLVIELVKNNTGIAWAFVVILVFLYAIFHVIHDGVDGPIMETLKTLLAGAAGWMGNMLTGRLASTRLGDQSMAMQLPPGVAGTKDTTVVTTTEMKLKEEQAVEALPKDKDKEGKP